MNETIHEFQARAARRLEEHDARIRAPLERDLRRANRALAVARATITIERARYAAACEALKRLRDTAAAAGPGREWYTAIVAELRVLGIDPTADLSDPTPTDV